MEEPATRDEFVALLRRQVHDHDVIGRYEMHATDMLLALNNAQPWFDPAYAELGDDERQLYIQAQAERLAPELFRFMQSWALQRLELASDWRRRTGRP